MRITVGLAVALLLATALPTGVAAADPIVPPRAGPSVTPAELVVRFRPDLTPAERAAAADRLGLTERASSRDGSTAIVSRRDWSPLRLARALRADRDIVAVAPNYRRWLTDDPTDDLVAEEWALYNNGQVLPPPPLAGVRGVADVDIDGVEALRLTHGETDVVVAVIDDGVDFSHSDLVDRQWTNPGEAGPLATNGLDDDGNGFVDDVHGWDFCNDDAVASPDGADLHGTHIAGTIAASANGSGVVGVAPGVSIVSIRAFEQLQSCSRPGELSDDALLASAIAYADALGVPIINASWGGFGESAVLDDAIRASGALFVAAAGNGGVDLAQEGFDFWPAESAVPNVLSVAAVDQRGRRASFSNWGAATIDIGAPGTNILSTVPGGYKYLSGTSMATPHVSGVAALVASSTVGTPSASVLKSRILGRGVSLPALRGKTVTGRLVNAWRSVDVAGPTALPVERHAIHVGTILGSTISSTVSWPAATDPSGVANYIVKRRIGSGGPTTLADGITARSRRSAVPIGSTVRFGVAGRDRLGNVGLTAYGPSVLARTYQDGTSVATYAGRWSTISSTGASNGRFHRTTRAGASVEFRTTARSIGIVARKGPANGKANVYVDGVYIRTIDLHRSATQSRVIVFSHAWPTSGSHRVKVVAIGTAGHPGVDIDAFAVLR